MSKRIWIFNHYAAPPSIATGTRHYNFGKYLQQMGYVVTIFAASAIHNSDKNLITDGQPYITDESEGVPFVFLRTRQYKGNGLARVRNMLEYYRGLFKVTKQFEKPDVIVASSVHPLACVAGIKIAKKLGVPCICEIRDLWPESIVEYQGVSRRNPLIWALYKLEKWIYMKADRLIFTMEGGKAYIAEQPWAKGFDFTKVFHINNGVDLDEFEQNVMLCPVEDEDLRNPDLFKVVYVGSIRLVNGVMMLVHAAEKLQFQADIKILIWGDGDQACAVNEYIKENGLKNIVLKGKVDKKKIPSILRQTDATIMHGKQTQLMRYGLSANKIFEYFAAGKPIISTLIIPNDTIVAFQAGYVVKEQSAEQIAEKILSLYHCGAEQYTMHCMRAKEAAKEFDYQKLTKDLDLILKGCM